MPTIDDLIDNALMQQPTKFASVFDAIMGEKTTTAIEAMHTSIAQSIYASDEDTDEQDTDEVDDDIDDDEFDDIDDLDLDEFDDIDDDEIESDDQDLEGFDDGEDA